MICWAHLTRTEQKRTCITRWARPADYRHGAKYRTGESRTASVAARAALRALLAETTGRADWQIIHTPRGKPELRTPEGRRGPAISLSHSHGEIAVAVATGMPGIRGLGIDLEIIRPRKAYQQIAARAFGPQECRYIEERGLNAFYRIWTLREAMGKTSGAGLLMAADGADKIRSTPSLMAMESRWGLFSTRSGNAMLAIAARGMVPKGLNVLQRITKLSDSRGDSPLRS